MTNEEALQEARRRFGPCAYAVEKEEYKKKRIYRYDIGFETPVENDIHKTLLGWGYTWEEAFELADVRATWHTITKDSMSVVRLAQLKARKETPKKKIKKNDETQMSFL